MPRPELPSDELSNLDRILDRFESGWIEGRRPGVEDYLEGLPGDRRRLLVELVHAELELRLKAGETARVEDYLQRFPELTEAPEVLHDLIAAEYKFRRRSEPRIAVEEYLARFPKHRRQLFAKLSSMSDTKREWAKGDDESTSRSPAGELSENNHTESTTRVLPRPEQLGHYKVERLLGSGGFGDVYLARHTKLGSSAAIKVPHLEVLETEKAAARFLDEARIAANLRHPGIVRVYDVGRQPDGTCFVVMEYVEGQPLQGLLTKERLDPHRVATMMGEVAEAVHFAHKQGFVHRDLKPANILIDETGHPHVADFGLAIHEDDQGGHEGEISGAPAYMAPEQVRGEAHRLDGRTDIWALGVILYEMLVGEAPFPGRK